MTFWDFLHSVADSSLGFQWASFIRFIRYMAALISFSLLGLYISLFSYHVELIPVHLTLSVLQNRHQVPLSVAGELLFMTMMAEVLQEATSRMPQGLGQAIGVVGGLILGQAAAAAGFISETVIIITATDMLASFTFPNFQFSLAMRLTRYWVVLWSLIYGLYGFVLAASVVIAHLCALDSFGLPYFLPVGPLHPRRLPGMILRAPAGSPMEPEPARDRP